MRRWWMVVPGLVWASTAMAGPAGTQVFPVSGQLVPVLVAAVFVLPAALAGIVSLVNRISRTGTAVAGALLILSMVALALVLLRPDIAGILSG